MRLTRSWPISKRRNGVREKITERGGMERGYRQVNSVGGTDANELLQYHHSAGTESVTSSVTLKSRRIKLEANDQSRTRLGPAYRSNHRVTDVDGRARAESCVVTLRVATWTGRMGQQHMSNTHRHGACVSSVMFGSSPTVSRCLTFLSGCSFSGPGCSLSACGRDPWRLIGRWMRGGAAASNPDGQCLPL